MSMNIATLDTMNCFRRRRRFAWTVEELDPIVTYVHPSGARRPFFTELMLLPLQSGRGRFYCGLYAGYEHARKEDWLEWIDFLFAPGVGLDACARVAERHGMTELKIWLMLPYPPPGDYLYVSGDRNQSFDSRHHRLIALQSAVETIVERWERSFRDAPIRLMGFVWGREGIPESDAELAFICNERISTFGLERMWLPNYRSNRVIEWRELGFSQVAIFPNYTGNSEYGKEWLQNTSKFAALNRMGIQIVNGKGTRFDRRHPKEYFKMANTYRRQGGEGPFVFTFPNRSLLELYRDDRRAYDDTYDFFAASSGREGEKR
ncbi:DUF4855 domain-containing protein [Paenibacillus sp. TRM 82003]|nr:DUF4855 domain-containing protein [Paenibacillus sp. TRM 82003]